MCDCATVTAHHCTFLEKNRISISLRLATNEHNTAELNTVLLILVRIDLLRLRMPPSIPLSLFTSILYGLSMLSILPNGKSVFFLSHQSLSYDVLMNWTKLYREIFTWWFSKLINKSNRQKISNFHKLYK